MENGGRTAVPAAAASSFTVVPDPFVVAADVLNRVVLFSTFV
jgi:hypothetical protein